MTAANVKPVVITFSALTNGHAMQTVFTHGGYNPWNCKAKALIEMRQSEDKKALFTVIYGAQYDENLTYARAAKKLGEALMHHLACEGLLNNEGA